MHDFIASAGDVVAVTVADKLTNADLSAMMDRIQAAMAAHERDEALAWVRGGSRSA